MNNLIIRISRTLAVRMNIAYEFIEIPLWKSYPKIREDTNNLLIIKWDVNLYSVMKIEIESIEFYPIDTR